METTKYEFEVSPGRMVVLQELSTGQFEDLCRAASGGADPAGANWELTNNGVRRSLISDGGAELTYKDLIGPMLAGRFRPAELMLLRQAWERIHLPQPEDMARVRAMRVLTGS